jgi:hypothetical protein
MRVRIEGLLDRLERVRKAGAGFVARCPGHLDRSPSLSIREADDGRILVHDFGGCSVLDVVASIGLKLRDLFPDDGLHRRRTTKSTEDPVVTRSLDELRRRLTKREQVAEVTIIKCVAVAVELALARGLALTVEGEICVIALQGEKC